MGTRASQSISISNLIMARYARRRRRRVPTRPRYRRRRRATGVRRQIRKLWRATKRQYRVIHTANFVDNTNFANIGTGSGAALNVHNLVPITTSQPLFGIDSNDQQKNSCTHVRMRLQMRLSAHTETDPVSCSAFVVTVKPSVADSVIDTSTGSLQLAYGVHYWSRFGWTQLNPKAFNVLWAKTWTFNNNPNHDGFNVPQSYTVYKKFKLRNRITNLGGNWSALNYPRKPNHNIFLLIFSDNVSADLENPNYRFNCVNTFIE